MKRIKPLGKVSLKLRVLRLLRIVEGYGGFTRDREEKSNVATITNNYHDYQRHVECALLNAERMKAEALMEWQQRRTLC